jgi:hypothetical protein
MPLSIHEFAHCLADPAIAQTRAGSRLQWGTSTNSKSNQTREFEFAFLAHSEILIWTQSVNKGIFVALPQE